MKKKNKTVYFLTINNSYGFFQFHVWATCLHEAKSLVIDVYNNQNYDDNLPKNRHQIKVDEVVVENIYEKKIKSHVISSDWSPSIQNADDYSTNCVNNFIDEMSKVIDEFEDREA